LVVFMKENVMAPLEVSARFAAYMWYVNNRTAPQRTKQAEARRFASDHWRVFTPVAKTGVGELLLKIAEGRKPRHILARMSRRLTAAL
jgi:hypothetical protein